MNDKIYSRLKKHYNEVYSVQPNTLHNDYLDGVFKSISKWTKTFPFKVFIPAAILVALVMYLLFGSIIVRLVTVLQYGF